METNFSEVEDNVVEREQKKTENCEREDFDGNEKLVHDSLKVFLMWLKIVGMYFDITNEEGDDSRATNVVALNNGTSTDVSIVNLEKDADMEDKAIKLERYKNSTQNKNKQNAARPKKLFLKMFYPTVVLIWNWFNCIRLFTLFKQGEKLNSDFIFKLIILIYIFITASYQTAFYYACYNGKIDKIFAGLSQAKGVSCKYLRKSATALTVGSICFSIIASGLLIFGTFKITWMFQKMVAPFYSWIEIDDWKLDIALKIFITVFFVFEPPAAVSAISFTMLVSLTMRKCFRDLESDLKQSIITIPGVYSKLEKKKKFSSLTFKSNSVVPSAYTRENGVMRVNEATETKPNFSSGKDEMKDRSLILRSRTSNCKLTKKFCEDVILNAHIQDHENKIFLTNSIEYFRQRYQSTARLVKKADSFICICIGIGITGFLLEAIMVFYTLILRTCLFENYATIVIIMAFWTIVSISILIYISAAGVLVNNSANKVLEKLHDIDLLKYPAEVGHNLLVFISRSNTQEGMGFTVFRIFMIDKNTIMTCYLSWNAQMLSKNRNLKFLSLNYKKYRKAEINKMLE
ncbi:hypothetical protein HELRODRAFT_163317 [Helobdella robusta]|uniref:Gustatory receptor n=1 Tax=Helobdella robusta TaxID=6412 RepID=T1ETW6_HELRO|nr:hypothetical protein HELRODRAFT_163317 [Helobdella robusta]ESN96270.1 hypothetical protein HELRODRAFT_163317 [Helobdella robusta]